MLIAASSDGGLTSRTLQLSPGGTTFERCDDQSREHDRYALPSRMVERRGAEFEPAPQQGWSAY
ncbi:hypothetical protein [Kribbella sancticallisti]|uniref:hypothetical protein n=1 Tax=Kribbella sancticallisti TaxID=460087 RepID=UPI0031DE4CFE